MAGRRRYDWDERKIARFEREGRGRGEGLDYKPWLTVRDVPSRGCSRSHRIPCPRTGRICHLFSDLEAGAFSLAWFDDDVEDVREQFPLPREATVETAAASGIRHPRDRRSGCLLVQTTDLLLTKKGPGGRRLEAWAVKYEADLLVARALEKLEIERSFWLARGVAWRLRTERHAKTTLTANLAWLLDDHPPVPEDLRNHYLGYERALVASITGAPAAPLHATCLAFDRALRVEPGTGLELARRMLATKRLVADLGHRRALDMSGAEFSYASLS